MGDVNSHDGVDPKHREALRHLDERLHGSEERFRRVEGEMEARIRAVQMRRGVISRDDEE